MVALAKKSPNRIFISILQNGREIAKRMYSYGKRNKIFISNSNKKSLYIPQYPLADDIKILESSKKGAKIIESNNIEGFVVKGNSAFNCNDIIDDENFSLKPKDMASLRIGDLQILIKIGQEKKEIIKLSSKYKKVSLTKFWLGSGFDIKILVFATFLTTFMYGGFILGLYNKPDNRPSNFSDLNFQYVLPFINKKHIQTFPEAVQKKLDRDKPLRQILSHYISLTNLLLGNKINVPPWIFPSTVKSYRSIYSRQDKKIREIEMDNKNILVSNKIKKTSGTLSVPLVKGESFQQSILRNISTLDLYHKSLEVNKEYRYKFLKKSKSFQIYNFQNYTNVKGKPAPSLLENSTRNKLTDEDKMYLEFDLLAKKADIQQKNIRKNRYPIELIDQKNASYIAIDPNISNLQLYKEDNFDNLDGKYIMLSASSFKEKRKDPVKEPIVGKIDPKKIRRAVLKRQHQLQLCYENALRRDFKLKGSMEWEWILDSIGKISEISLIDNSINDNEMIHCIKSKIAKWKLPAPKNGSVKIRFPFTFNRAKG